MREIKFRAWCNNEQYDFVELTSYKDGSLGVSIATTGFSDLVSAPTETIIEQYTGLKDKNGVEIYEGDLVKLLISHKSHKNKVFKIIYTLGGFCLKIKDNAPTSIGLYFYEAVDNRVIDSWKDCDGSVFEVIGNIHENPELIN